MKSIPYRFLEKLPVSFRQKGRLYFSNKFEKYTRWAGFLVSFAFFYFISSNWVFISFFGLVLFFSLLVGWDFYRTPAIEIPEISGDRNRVLLRQEGIYPKSLESLISWITQKRFTTLFFTDFNQLRKSEIKSSKSLLLLSKGNFSTAWTCAYPIFRKYNQRMNLFVSGYQRSKRTKSYPFWPVLPLEEIDQAGYLTLYEMREMFQSGYVRFEHWLDPLISESEEVYETFCDDLDLLYEVQCNDVLAWISEDEGELFANMEFQECHVFNHKNAFPNNRDFPEQFSYISPQFCGIVFLDHGLLRLEILLERGHFYLLPLVLLFSRFNQYVLPWIFKMELDLKISRLKSKISN